MYVCIYGKKRNKLIEDSEDDSKYLFRAGFNGAKIIHDGVVYFVSVRNNLQNFLDIYIYIYI